MKHKLVVILCFLPFAYACGQDRKHAETAQQEIIQLEKQMFAAIQKKDTAAISRILADDFVLRTPGAPPADKKAFLAAIQGIPAEIVAVWSEDLAANIYGDTGVLTGTQLARVRDGGKEAVSAQAFTDIFIRRGGRWQLALAHSVEIPSPQKP